MPFHSITGAKVVLHTHQTWATALNMLKDNRLVPASQRVLDWRMPGYAS
jgi:ribulose-5-phosphate 4-epimerase/fuculose-1-phosphate aldolase